MKTPHDPWLRLVAAARRAPVEDRLAEMPVGFATRVLARAWERSEKPLLGLFDRFSWRALGLAGGLAVASVVLNVTPVLQAFHEEELIVDPDPVALVLDLR